jgi:glycosyltransferase involved in cell wall biosynthesis
MEKVTVIMNTLNEDRDFLIQAIESYLCQKEAELIVSTVEGDHSIEICKAYPQIKVVTLTKAEHSDNGERSPSGAYKQINNALQHVKTDWWCYASSNDISHPHKLSMEVSECIKHGKLICYSAFDTMNEKGERTNTRRFPEYNYKRHLEANFVNDCSMIHRSILEEFLPFDLSLKNLGHWDLWLRVYESKGDVFCYNPNPTWSYRIHETSMRENRLKDDKKRKAEQLDRIRMIEKHINLNK